MNGYNKIILLGYLGHDPELMTSTKGKQYTHLSIATRRTHMAQHENKEVVTDWHQVKVWGPQAQTCAKYLRKGSGVMVEGYLSPYETQTPQGEMLKKVGIHALKVEFLPRAKNLEN